MTLTNWSVDPVRGSFTVNHEVKDHLPAGMYRLRTDAFERAVATGQKLKDDNLFRMSSGPMDKVVSEISRFWDCRKHYVDLGMTHKRGLLMHGPAGCGKTAIISALMEDAIKRDGLVFPLQSIDDFTKAFTQLRQLEAERDILITIEDIEDVCNYDEEELLELLDGATSLGHGILFVATTNYLAKVPVRLRCRPSRFDTVLEIPLPDEATRREYLEFVCQGPLSAQPGKLDEWAAASHKFSLASLKELVLSIVVYERSLEETVDRLKDLSSQTDDDG